MSKLKALEDALGISLDDLRENIDIVVGLGLGGAALLGAAWYTSHRADAPTPDTEDPVTERFVQSHGRIDEVVTINQGPARITYTEKNGFPHMTVQLSDSTWEMTDSTNMKYVLDDQTPGVFDSGLPEHIIMKVAWDLQEQRSGHTMMRPEVSARANQLYGAGQRLIRAELLNRENPGMYDIPKSVLEQVFGSQTAYADRPRALRLVED